MTDFWKGKRVLVAGGHGFVGSAICEAVRSRFKTTDINQKTIISSSLIIPNTKNANLTSHSDVKRLIEGSNPDIIIHAAGMVGNRSNRDKPAELFYNNLIMGAQLMHEAWKFNPKIKFVNLGTARSYSPLLTSPVGENEFWHGYPDISNSNYAMAKSILLVQSQAYRRQYDFNAIYLILANVYGPGDNFSDSSPVIPSFIKKIYNHKSGVLDFHGSHNTEREFIYIDDAVRAILSAVENYSLPEPLNIGSGKLTTMAKIEKTIKSYLNKEYAFTWGRELSRSVTLDTSNAELYLNFRSEIDLEEGIKRTVSWYLEQQ